MQLVVIDQVAEPVINKGFPGTEDNQYGFEGGTVFWFDGSYHLFTTEMFGNPRMVNTRLAHWSGRTVRALVRQNTLMRSTSVRDGIDPMASVWAPMPVFDTALNRWSMFYVAYRSALDTPTEMKTHFRGTVRRALSDVAGPQGLGGPYADDGIVLEPGVRSQPWEGLQGTDSFFPYQVGNRWYGFYGSAATHFGPQCRFWGVGLAMSESLGGPWKRLERGNPLPIDPRFAENPVVSRLSNGTYVAVYDGGPAEVGSGGMGYTTSEDGVHWGPGTPVVLDPAKARWQRVMRTPLGLLPDSDREFTVLYTAWDNTPLSYGAIGMVRLALEA